jgi:hypothetical protein
MMKTREELLAEREAIDAQIAAMDDPFCAEIEALCLRYFETDWGARDLATAALRRGMELAPRAVMGEAEIEALVEEIMGKWCPLDDDRREAQRLARLSIHRTLSRAPVAAWPGEAICADEPALCEVCHGGPCQAGEQP